LQPTPGTPGTSATGTVGDATSRATRALLACGVAAGPLYVAVAVVQLLTRDGFDPRRHPVSLLSNGDLGWIQITNFVVTGLLTVAAAVGMRRVLHPGRGGTWGPLLVGAYGVGLVAAGIFVADPADGFPPGTPPGTPDQLSWHGALHFAVAGLAFLSLIAACFVVARRFAALGQRGWASYSVATGVAFLASWVALVAWPDNDAVNLALGVGVVLGWAWVSALSARLRAGLAAPPADR
jgi:hypothetical membrane protein